MHVYGWPITVKLASYGWQNRRAAGHGEANRVDSCNVDTGRRVGNGSLKVDEHRTKHLGARSYAAVLTENQKEVQSKETRAASIRMKWDGNQGSAGWLAKSALGVLKQFKDLSAVNQRLLSRGFIFSSHFLGDKRIVWQFNSEIDCIGFIKNQFFWEDCFLSMDICPLDVVARSRLRWVELFGVPLRCWDASFFMSIGRMLGVPLLIEEETLNIARLDRGRILISIPFDSKRCEKIWVSEHDRSFEVSIEQDALPMDQEWKKYRHDRGGDFHNTRFTRKEEFKRHVNPFPSQHTNRKDDVDFLAKKWAEKGKAIFQKNHRVRQVVPQRCNTGVILEKRRVYMASEDETSYSSSEASGRIRYQVGECSKVGQDWACSGPTAHHEEIRPNDQLSIGQKSDEEDRPNSEINGPSCYGTRVPESNLDPILVGPRQQDPHLLVSNSAHDQFVGRELNDFDMEFQRDHNTVGRVFREEAIQLQVDLGTIHE
ncbi:hypothetical protein Q3G72_034869 [Acer saccharum]|nr:hypothetical protein Q3G72_034869 [Acer saccharum]